MTGRDGEERRTDTCDGRLLTGRYRIWDEIAETIETAETDRGCGGSGYTMTDLEEDVK